MSSLVWLIECLNIRSIQELKNRFNSLLRIRHFWLTNGRSSHCHHLETSTVLNLVSAYLSRLFLTSLMRGSVCTGNYPVDSIIRTLEQNRPLFEEATSKYFGSENGNLAATDYETDNNYGFSLGVSRDFEYEFDQPVSCCCCLGVRVACGRWL